MHSSNALYTDLSGYYDLMCADIDYQAQSQSARRLHQFFGTEGKTHLDLACGTGPHIRHFLDAGYQSSGLDLNQPMLDKAQQRCPEARFILQNMCDFQLEHPVDLVTCFLYSIHYSASIKNLKACIASVFSALKPGGVFCFNSVDKDKIDNSSYVRHSAVLNNSHFVFESGWNYSGTGEQQSLNLSIEKTTADLKHLWQDQHPMVAISFAELEQLLCPYFEVHVLEHNYEKIAAWDKHSGNALFVCIKR
ncbi:class I SAM-dependent DNA methyltransferase [Rheinheimera soli]|uniref:class I SAM-dependent DNA methyltransferase n=1 Tax=Rheinheimera soli TaxID=443616 RepID=UPI001E4226B1|nr:class I SAM-dependent methyltransferase [Rheinheimera soli]